MSIQEAGGRVFSLFTEDYLSSLGVYKILALGKEIVVVLQGGGMTFGGLGI